MKHLLSKRCAMPLVILALAAPNVSIAQFGIYQDENGNLRAKMEILKPGKVTRETYVGEITQKHQSGDLEYTLKDKSSRTTSIDEKTIIVNASKKKIDVSEINIGDKIRVQDNVNEMRMADGTKAYTIDTKRIELLPRTQSK